MRSQTACQFGSANLNQKMDVLFITEKKWFSMMKVGEDGFKVGGKLCREIFGLNQNFPLELTK